MRLLLSPNSDNSINTSKNDTNPLMSAVNFAKAKIGRLKPALEFKERINNDDSANIYVRIPTGKSYESLQQELFEALIINKERSTPYEIRSIGSTYDPFIKDSKEKVVSITIDRSGPKVFVKSSAGMD